ncbi:MAG: hypothetical protein HRT77_12995 [Halioglobus sp.]|nr:hypothetical protein [Halioglobus sp.]
MSFLRTVVVGSPGSGKSTFSAQLSSIIGIEHTELDAIFWQPGWQPTDEKQFVDTVSNITDEDAWIIDGNYAPTREYIWPRATAVVWLDLPLYKTLFRLFRRTLKRIKNRETCCNGNRESLKSAFLNKDSVLFWALISHGKYVSDYTDLLESNPGLKSFRLKTDRDVQKLLSAARTACAGNLKSQFNSTDN